MRGKIVIAIIIAVALALSGFAWWYRFQGGRQSAEWWGRDALLQVRYAPRVDFVPLERADADASTDSIISITGNNYRRGTPVDVTQSRGMVHVRHALVDDLSFSWSDPPTTTATWDLLLVFEDPKDKVEVAIDVDDGVICLVDEQRMARFIPKIAEAFRHKYADWQKLVP